MPSEADIQALADRSGLTVALDGDEAAVGELNIAGVSQPDRWFQPALEDIMPRRPRGDYRERTVNLLVRDAISNPGPRDEKELFAPGEGAFYTDRLLASDDAKRTFGDLLSDHYVIETSGRKTRFLFPFHSDLPGNFRFSGRYKMFNGLILAFIARPGTNGAEFNTDLLDEFYGLFNDERELSLLDQHTLRIARNHARERGIEQPKREATAEELIETFGNELRLPPFLPEAHKLFQADLETALRMRSLGRKDRVNAVLTVFYLHLALYFWRIGYVLEEQADLLTRYFAGEAAAAPALETFSTRTLEASPFRGRIQFRVASARPRSVAESDPCAASFRDVNDRRLLLLPVNISLLAAGREFLGKKDSNLSFADIAAAAAQNEALLKSFDCVCRLVSLSVAEKFEGQQRDDIRALAMGSEPGFLALRTALLKGWRSELRRSSTDITAQLMRRGGKGLSATRGRVKYFELGQDLLLLLTKLIARDEAVRYGDFLERLSLYGLSPQDEVEEDLLADVLHSLQLLEKYSDTGEAKYVQHFL